MFDPPRSDDNLEKDGENPPPGDGPSDPPAKAASPFVAFLLACLRKHGSEDVRECVELMRQRGPMSSEDLASFIDGVDDPKVIRSVLWGYSIIFERYIDRDTAQALPGFFSLCGRVLFVDAPEDKSIERMSSLFACILDDMLGNRELEEAVRSQLTPQIRSKIEDLIVRCPTNATNYLDLVELYMSLYPDLGALELSQRIFEPRSEGKSANSHNLLIFVRGVSGIAQEHFGEVFDRLVEHESSDRFTSYPSLRDAFIDGLSSVAASNVTTISRMIQYGDTTQQLTALRILSAAATNKHVGPFSGAGVDLLNVIRPLLADADNGGTSIEVREELYCALAHLAARQVDRDAVKRYIDGEVHEDRGVSARVVAAHARWLSFTHELEPLRRLAPLPQEYEPLLRSPGSHKSLADIEDIRIVRTDPGSAFESLAVDITSCSTRREVEEESYSIIEFLDPEKLRPRSPDALNIFYDRPQAKAFAQRYLHLVRSAPPPISAALFPELLSALVRASDGLKGKVNQEIARCSREAMKILSVHLAEDERLRAIAAARFSAKDWAALSSLHTMGSKVFGRTHTDLALAAFGVRACVDPESRWRQEAVEFLSGLSQRETREMDQKAVRFLGKIIETRKVGGVWDFIALLRLDEGGAYYIRELSFGALRHPATYIQRCLEGIDSDRGDTVARSLMIAQLLDHHLSNKHRHSLVEGAKRYLDDIGALALDALLTVGALSRSQEDAVALLKLQTPLGVEHALYSVTKAEAAAEILRNRDGEQ